MAATVGLKHKRIPKPYTLFIFFFSLSPLRIIYHPLSLSLPHSHIFLPCFPVLHSSTIYLPRCCCCYQSQTHTANSTASVRSHSAVLAVLFGSFFFLFTKILSFSIPLVFSYSFHFNFSFSSSFLFSIFGPLLPHPPPLLPVGNSWFICQGNCFLRSGKQL